MDTLGASGWSVVDALLLAGILPTVLVAVAAYVLTWNYRSPLKETFSPDLIQGEQVVDQLRIRRRLVFTETWLSDHRVLQARTAWLLSRRRVLALALEDVNSVKLERRLSVAYLAVAVLFWGTLNPVALGLLLFTLENPFYAVRFEPSVADMPLTRITCLTFLRGQWADVVRFWRNAVGHWSQRRMHKGLPAPVEQAGVLEHLFGWGRPVWCYLAIFLLAGTLQRVTQGHVSFDDYIFLPFYLGLPAAAAGRNLRDGVWCAVLGFAVLFTVLYPMKGPFGGTGWLDDYLGRGLAVQQVLILGCMVLTALLARAIARNVHPSLTFLAPALWLALVFLHMPSVFYDLGLYAKVCFAMFAVAPLSLLDRALLARA